MKPYYQENGITLYEGDCREAMAAMPRESIDTIITDPPYGLKFMGKAWDRAVPGPDFWTPALDVCKPGAMLMAFGGTRLYHRMICAIEDSGWEIRDCLMWLYGSGFPKSHDISKAIDKAAGAEREKVRIPAEKVRNAKVIQCGHGIAGGDRPWMVEALKNGFHEKDGDIPATPEAEQWNGWGTALKPAWEPIVLAMKPLDGTFAQNALKHGVAGLNIDGGRIGTEDNLNGGAYAKGGSIRNDGWGMERGRAGDYNQPKGRWPANLIAMFSGIVTESSRGILYAPLVALPIPAGLPAFSISQSLMPRIADIAKRLKCLFSIQWIRAFAIHIQPSSRHL